MALVINQAVPQPSEYANLRTLAGWGEISTSVAEKALRNTALSICAREDGLLVGLSRAVGDGVLYFYISDVFVHPGQRGLGLGQKLLRELVEKVSEASAPGATIAVLSAPGREDFYQSVGFQPCPNAVFGQGMTYLEPIERILGTQE